MTEELEVIASCFDKQFKNYQKILEQIEFNSNEYCILDDNYKEKKVELLQSYINECDKFPSTFELEINEKAACLAMAIKHNNYFIVTDKFGFMNYTYLNSLFAIDVALKFYEYNLSLDYLDNSERLDVNSVIQYTKGLLAEILEHKNVTASDISSNIKKQMDLFVSIIQSKVNTKK